MENKSLKLHAFCLINCTFTQTTDFAVLFYFKLNFLAQLKSLFVYILFVSFLYDRQQEREEKKLI